MSDDELAELRSGLRKLLDSECTGERVRAAAETPSGLDRALWRHLTESGWASLGVTEELGGGGGGAAEIGAVCEEIGRVLGPTVLSLTVAVSGPTLCAAGTERSAALAERCAAGEEIVVPVLTAGDGTPDPARLPVHARATPDGVVLSGMAPLVLDAAAVDTLLVAARDDDGGVGIYLVPAASTERTVRPGVDITRRLVDIRLPDVVVPESDVLWQPGAGGAAAYSAMVRGALLALTAEALGGLSELLRRTVDFARVRQQFNRPIGSFQAIKHRLADIYVSEHSARAALVIAQSTAANSEVGQAKAFVTDAFAHAAAEALQIHGGIGYTWEHDVHLFLKRAELDAAVFGSSRWHALQALPDLVARAAQERSEVELTSATRKDNHA